MAFIQTADDMADNSIRTLSNVLDSKFTPFLQGYGTPVLVTYYHIDNTTSTANPGDGTIDKLLGSESPIRYNKIENFPVVGLREILPTKDEIDGNLVDMTFDGEVIIFPNTIDPTPYDFIEYRFPNGDSITFTITDVEMGSIKSNSYYKLSIALKDINDTDTIDKLDKQLSDTYTTELDNVGTQDKCIIKSTKFDKIKLINKIISYICEQYVDIFYVKDYNALIHRPSDAKYAVYDPYLTKFVIDNSIFDLQSRYFINLVQYDTRYEVSRMYNKTIYHNIEIGDKTKVLYLLKSPISFSNTVTNPFAYFGEEVGFTLDLEETEDTMLSDRFYYVPKNLVERIRGNQIITDGDTVSNDYNRVISKEDGFNITVDNIIENVSTEDDDIITNDDEDTIADDGDIGTNDDVPKEDIEEEEPEISPNAVIFDMDDNMYSHLYWNLIITYLNKDKPFMLLEDSRVNLEQLLTMSLEDNFETYMYTPIILYIMKKYVEFLQND